MAIELAASEPSRLDWHAIAARAAAKVAAPDADPPILPPPAPSAGRPRPDTVRGR